MKNLFTIALLTSAACFGQVTASSGNVAFSSDGQYTINVWMSTRWFSGVQTTLAAPLDSSSTSFTLASGTGLGPNSLLLVDGGTVNAELIQIGAKSGASITGAVRAIVPVAGCAAGAVCTVAVAHAAGATVQELRTKGNSALTATFVYSNFMKQVIIDNVSAMQDQVGNPTIATQLAIIAAAQAAIAAAKTAAVQ